MPHPNIDIFYLSGVGSYHLEMRDTGTNNMLSDSKPKKIRIHQILI